MADNTGLKKSDLQIEDKYAYKKLMYPKGGKASDWYKSTQNLNTICE